MKTTLIKLLVTIVCMSTTVQCKLPVPANFDQAGGRIIYKGVCQNEPLYLINLDRLLASKSGYNYKDSLTVYGVKYMNVVKIDTSQTSLLSNNKIGDKINLEFDRGPRRSLPTCSDIRRGDIQTIYLLRTGAAVY